MLAFVIHLSKASMCYTDCLLLRAEWPKIITQFILCLFVGISALGSIKIICITWYATIQISLNLNLIGTIENYMQVFGQWGIAWQRFQQTLQNLLCMSIITLHTFCLFTLNYLDAITGTKWGPFHEYGMIVQLKGNTRFICDNFNLLITF